MRKQPLSSQPIPPQDLVGHWETAAYVTTPRLLDRHQVPSEIGYRTREANLTASEVMWVTLHEGTGAGYGLKKLPHHGAQRL